MDETHPDWDTLIRPHWFWWVSVIGGLGLLAAIALHPGVYEVWTTHVHELPDRKTMLWILLACLPIHLGEAWYVHRATTTMGMRNSNRAWVIQSFTLGLPSTHIIIRRKEAWDNARKALSTESEG